MTGPQHALNRLLFGKFRRCLAQLLPAKAETTLGGVKLAQIVCTGAGETGAILPGQSRLATARDAARCHCDVARHLGWPGVRSGGESNLSASGWFKVWFSRPGPAHARRNVAQFPPGFLCNSSQRETHCLTRRVFMLKFLGATLATLTIAGGAHAAVIDFETNVAGDVLTSFDVGGVTGTISAVGGTDQAMIFDSNNYTGGDSDLQAPVLQRIHRHGSQRHADGLRRYPVARQHPDHLGRWRRVGPRRQREGWPDHVRLRPGDHLHGLRRSG